MICGCCCVEPESRGKSADRERRVEWMEGWERRVRRRVGREVEVGEGGVVGRRMSGLSRMRRILGEGVVEEERSLVRDWLIRGWEVERLGGDDVEGEEGGEEGVQELFR